LLLALGLGQLGLFGVLAPPDSGHQWLEDAYNSWWASFPRHPFGFIWYILLMTLGIFTVLVQSIVGFFAIYAILILSATCSLDLDWLNRDSAYGWRAMATAFSTVLISLALHGSTLSVVLLVLGLDKFPWVIGIVGIWIVVLPTFTLVPAAAFAGVRRRACAERIAEIDRMIVANNVSDVLKLAAIRAEIEAVHRVKASPLRVRRTQLPAFLVAVLLPIFLTAVQVFFSVRFGQSPH
jgi:hypothetical protein